MMMMMMMMTMTTTIMMMMVVVFMMMINIFIPATVTVTNMFPNQGSRKGATRITIQGSGTVNLIEALQLHFPLNHSEK